MDMEAYNVYFSCPFWKKLLDEVAEVLHDWSLSTEILA